MEISLKCKDFDAWVSFLGRLNKVGSFYILKNNILMALVKGTKSGTNDSIPGRHLIKDPLYMGETTELDAVYGFIDLNNLIDIFKGIKENNPEARKTIIYKKDTTGIYIKFNGMGDFQIAKRIDMSGNDEYANRCKMASASLTCYEEYLNTPNPWINISTNDIIALRNNELRAITQDIGDGVKAWTRISRSIFTMAGVTRLGVPFADNIDYTFLHSDTIQKDTALLRLHSIYKSPGSSKLISVDCIHEYVVLLW